MPARKQTKDGRWAMWLDFGKDADGNRQRKRVEAKTKRECEAKAAELRARHDDGEDLTAKPRTVNELLDDWLQLKAQAGKAPNSIAAYRSAAKNHLRPTLGPMLVTQLRHKRREIQRVFTDLAEHLAPTNVRLVKTVLVQALDLAVTQGEIAFNPAEKVSTPPVKRSPARALTEDERGRLLFVAEHHRYGVAVRVALLGMRRGEIAGLRWEDINWTAGTITVRRQVQKRNGKWEAKDLKGDAPPRVLTVGTATLEALRAHQSRQEDERGAMGWENTGWVFVSARTGGVCPSSTLYDAFVEMCKAARVDAARLHDCRHTAATAMLASGEDVATVSGALGHATPAITMSVYAHALPHRVADATRRLDDLLRPAPRPDEAADAEK